MSIDNIKESVMSESLRLYLRETKKYKLIDKEREHWLAAEIRAMLDITGDFRKGNYNLSQYPAEQHPIIKRGVRAFNEMFHANLRLVVMVARRYEHKSAHIEIESLIQFGNLGLIKAIEKYDPSANGVKFVTYGYPWIRQYICRGITNTGRMIRLPIHISDRLDKIRYEQNKYFQKNGIWPDKETLAQLSKLTVKELEFVYESNKAVVSLNCRVSGDDETELESLVENEYEVSSYEPIETSEVTEAVHRMLLSLESRERMILEMLYGIGTEKKSLTFISEVMGLSKYELDLKIISIVEKLKRDFSDLTGLIKG